MATQTFQVRVDARIPWQATDILVQEGDRLRIEVPNPSLPNVYHPKPWPWGPNCDPNGNRSDGVPSSTWEDAIAPNLIVFALVGRIEESGEPFLVGSSFDQPAPASGYLYLSYNDGVNFSDNSGYWDVVVTVEPPCPGGGVGTKMKANVLIPIGVLWPSTMRSNIRMAQTTTIQPMFTIRGQRPTVRISFLKHCELAITLRPTLTARISDIYTLARCHHRSTRLPAIGFASMTQWNGW